MTDERARALDLDRARQVVSRHCFPSVTTREGPGRVGLEVESFPVRVSADGHAIGRVPLSGPEPVSLAGLLAASPRAGALTVGTHGAPTVAVAGGGRLSVEPGAQLEHATAVHDTAAGALDEVRDVASHLAALAAGRGVALLSVGLDVWHRLVTLQIAAPRYRAMDLYLRARGTAGATMMRHTCALQINVDGGGRDRAERWLAANLVAPLLTATFACSPGRDAVSQRALTWQEVDPTRTGFPRRLVDGSTDDPVEQLLDAALAADVLVVRGSGYAPGRPGWTFGEWMRRGDPEHGWPTADDLAYHLTTLFHEVRPRGALELRAIDALPARWRAVPVVLVAGLVEDARARQAVLEVLDRHRRRLPQLSRRAATVGVADPALCALTVEVWSYALAGVARLPTGYINPDDRDRAERFLDRYTLRGRCPADDLRSLLSDDPTGAVSFTAEPLPTTTPTGHS